MRYIILLALAIVAASARSSAQTNVMVDDQSHGGLAGVISPALRAVAIVSAAPNSSGNAVEIDVVLREDAPITVELIGGGGEAPLGRVDAGRHAAGRGHLSVPLDALRAGSYIVRLSTPKGLAQKRVVIGD